MKRVKVKHPDFCQLAVAIVEAATDESEQVEDTIKNPQAVSSGRLGGKKGGPARASDHVWTLAETINLIDK